MRIRSGRNNILPSGGTSVPLPQNRGMSRIAQAAIDTLSTAAVRKSVEAIRTDGWPVYCHVSQKGSQLCSCHKDMSEEFAAEEIGGGDDLSLIAHDTLSPEDSVNGQSFKTTVRLRGFGVDDNLLESNTSRTPSKPTLEALSKSGVLTDDSIDGNYPPVPDSDFSDILSIFPSLGQKQCGICGGAGYVDAWRWVSGQKIFLLPEAAEMSGGVSVDQSTRPWTARFSDSSKTTSLQWTVNIPAYFICLEGIKIKDNSTLCTEFAFEARDPAISDDNDPNAWARFDNVFIQPYLQTGISNLKLRIRMKKRLEMGTYATFTHGEIWVKTNELPYCQFPQIDRDIQGGTLEALINTQFEIDPGIGRLSRGSLIENPNQGRMWLVSQVTNKETSKRYVFNIAGSITVLSPTDAPYGLAMVPRFNGKSPRHWRGLEVGPEGQGLAYEGGYVNVGQFENAGPLAGTRDKPYDDISVVTQDKADRP